MHSMKTLPLGGASGRESRRRQRRSSSQYRPRRIGKKQGGQPKLSAPLQGFIPGSPFVPMIPRLKGRGAFLVFYSI